MVEKLRVELVQSKNLERSIEMEVDVYNVQQATFSSLLFIPQIQIQTIESAFNALQVSYAIIHNQLEKLKSRNEYLTKANTASNELLSIISKQYADVSKLPGKSTSSITLQKKIAALRNLIRQKQKHYFKLQSSYSVRTARLEKAHGDFTRLSGDYKKILSDQSSRNLYYRDISPFSGQWPAHVMKLAREFGKTAEKMGKKEYWLARTRILRNSDLYDIVSFLLLLGLVFLSSRKLREVINSLYQKPLYLNNLSVQLPLNLIAKSITPLSIGLFLFAYQQIVRFSGISAFSVPLVDLLMVWIITGWGLHLLALKSATWVNKRSLKAYLNGILLFIRWFSLIYLLVSWLFEYDRLVLMVGRFMLELSLIGLSLSLWRIVRVQPKTSPERRAVMRPDTPTILATILMVIAFGGFVSELTGFSSLAMFWYLSWGRTAVLLLWGGLLAGILKEVDGKLKQQDMNESEVRSIASYQARWITVRLLQLGGPLVFALALVMAWGGQRSIQSNAYAFLSHKFQVGDMSFSLLSLLQAAMVIMATHVITRLWRYFFQKRFLNRSRMETGLQESITTVTVYAIWMLGIIIALNAFGLNPTSLVVVFGALGIGLGFGLQNIFNNFMSGLILLFERPIQEGDDIEINGTWATVRKINVRSTLVQTFDNASLIIPNSDLINNQVTNWSFKDKRLRRKVKVGVAYGSDIELVRKTLLEICSETKNVLNYPKPDVLFSDFGDSALIFKLRFWTYIAYMFEAETEVRFEIDRQFREKQITIAFPQQDVHFYPTEHSDAKDD